jgi:PilZ domain-containing protein
VNLQVAIDRLGDESWQLRYRFESLGALRRHLRLGAGFFLPEAALPCAPGSRVIVEVAVPETADRPLLHGRVRERLRQGVWLDLPLARPAARWERDPEGPQRRHRRVACDLLAEVQPRGGEGWLCRVLDVSDRGLRLATAFELGIPGDDLAVTLLAPDRHLAPPVRVRARVVWAASRETGLELIERGPGFDALVATASGRWERVREIEHGRDCACAHRADATGQRQP